jgi:hypothetical protein
VVNLLELRKYAIDQRSEIRFGDRHGHECVVNEKGQLRIPGEDKDFRIEDALEAAEMFEITGSGQAQRLTREALTRAITEAYGKKGMERGAGEDE